MAFVDVGVAVAGAFGAESIGAVGAGMIGSGLVGAGTGALMAGLSGKNILNGALIGGGLGAIGGGIGGAFGSTTTQILNDGSIATVNGLGQIVGGTAADGSALTSDAIAALNQSGSAATGATAASYGTSAGAGASGATVPGTNATTAPGTSNVATNAAKTAMTNPPPTPTNYGQYLKYGVPAAMMMYGSGIFGNKTTNPGITQQSTVGQSQPNPNIRGLSSNYQSSYPQSLMAAEGGIMKLATGGTGEAGMTPAVTQSTYNPADVNAAQSSTLSPATQALLNQYGISTTQAQPILSALQGQGIGTRTAAEGGIMGYFHGGSAEYNLGSYSDGGRLLKGPGDGMSDEIPATIAHKQPARLAEGEFVVPADVVSHLGNGSTEAGAKHLYKMMDNVRHARTGKKKQAKQIKADKFLPKTK